VGGVALLTQGAGELAAELVAFVAQLADTVVGGLLDGAGERCRLRAAWSGIGEPEVRLVASRRRVISWRRSSWA
jgi:hypothetical protein